MYIYISLDECAEMDVHLCRSHSLEQEETQHGSNTNKKHTNVVVAVRGQNDDSDVKDGVASNSSWDRAVVLERRSPTKVEHSDHTQARWTTPTRPSLEKGCASEKEAAALCAFHAFLRHKYKSKLELRDALQLWDRDFNGHLSEREMRDMFSCMGWAATFGRANTDLVMSAVLSPRTKYYS